MNAKNWNRKYPTAEAAHADLSRAMIAWAMGAASRCGQTP